MEQEAWPRAGAVPRAEVPGATRQRAGEPRRRPDAPTYAALDLGTNNCRLLIARPADVGVPRHRCLLADRPARRGDLATRPDLASRRSTRTIDALRICRDKIAAKRVDPDAPDRHRGLPGGRRTASTSCERVRGSSGIDLEIVDRETEARLAVTGCGRCSIRHATGAILFDIGGGSTEIVRLDCDPARGRTAPTHRAAGLRCRSASSRSPSAMAASR